MVVRFWGVRGSLPTPGPRTSRIGGNTACVSVEAEDQVLVFDAGTGARALGEVLAGTPREITLLTSHLHWDHVIGLPFFAPLYEKGRTVNLTLVRAGDGRRSPLEVLDGVHFPRHVSELPARCRVVERETEFLGDRGFELRCADLNHPGGALGFRVGRGPGSLVYMTDNELGAPPPTRSSFEAFVDFARDADILCHDAQYRAEEIDARRGWGHSTVGEACHLAIAAGVGELLLFHHDPSRDDDAVDRLEAEARQVLEPHGIRCRAAFEGLEIVLG